MSGIAGARGDNALGVTGVNWNVQILPLSIGAGAVIESVLECYSYVYTERKRYDDSNGTEGVSLLPPMHHSVSTLQTRMTFLCGAACMTAWVPWAFSVQEQRLIPM